MTIYKHVMSGPGAAGDSWTSGLHTSGTLAIGAAHTAWESFVNNLAGVTGMLPVWTTDTQVRELITYALNVTTGKATAVARSSIAKTGTSAGGQPDPRSCIVVGLRSAVPGPRGRGRMFLPAPSLDNLTPEGLFEDAVKATVAGAVAAGLADLGSDGFLPVVWSLTNAAGSAITSVTVGQVPGTQRSRSNKVLNAYTSAAVA